MLKIKFSFAKDKSVHSNGFDLGDMEFTGELGSVSSKGKLPSQSMMIVISIVTLMDGIRNLLSSDHNVLYKFVGIDSSFSIMFKKTGKAVCIYNKKTKISEISFESVRNTVEDSALEFSNETGFVSRLNEAEAVDFRHAIESFQRFDVKIPK